MTVQPLIISSKLFGNPPSEPKYKVLVKNKAGESVMLADPRATRAMIALMDMQAVMGGAASHWGGPSAFAELMSSVHAFMFDEAIKQNKSWTDLFHFVNDAGHCENGLYALKANYQVAGLNLESLKGFRSIESQLTGHGESHLFPEGVYISNGPLGSGLPQAQGLSAAEALSGQSRLTITAISDGACMEGEAKEALAAIPGLASKGQLSGFVLVISDNNTKLSGRIDDESFSMEPTFQSMSQLGWDVVEVKNGNDLQSCFSAIEEACRRATENPKVPVAIHARTVKGFGVKSTEISSSGGHGFPLKGPAELPNFLQEIYTEGELPAEFTAWANDLIEKAQNKTSSPKSGPPTVKVQDGVAKALIQCRQKGWPVLSITSDLPGSTGVAAFRKEFPECCFDVGVAESNMVSMAAGLSKQGYIPIVDTFSQFGVTKGGLPLIMASLSQAPVIAIFSHAGFQDAADGASHQALSYFAMTHAIPHTDTYVLSTSEEAENLVSAAVEEFYESRKKDVVPRSKIFFLGRETFVESLGCESYQLGKAQVVSKSSEKPEKTVTLVAAGPLLHQAMKAAEMLKAEGVGSFVVNPSVVNRPDVETISNCLNQSNGHLVIAEDHQVIGGLASVLVHALCESGVSVKVKTLGVRDEFGQSAYQANELYAKHGMDAQAIAKAASSFFV